MLNFCVPCEYFPANNLQLASVSWRQKTRFQCFLSLSGMLRWGVRHGSWMTSQRWANRRRRAASEPSLTSKGAAPSNPTLPCCSLGQMAPTSLELSSSLLAQDTGYPSPKNDFAQVTVFCLVCLFVSLSFSSPSYETYLRLTRERLRCWLLINNVRKTSCWVCLNVEWHRWQQRQS